jgi:hypothetical protein
MSYKKVGRRGCKNANHTNWLRHTSKDNMAKTVKGGKKARIELLFTYACQVVLIFDNWALQTCFWVPKKPKTRENKPMLLMAPLKFYTKCLPETPKGHTVWCNQWPHHHKAGLSCFVSVSSDTCLFISINSLFWSVLNGHGIIFWLFHKGASIEISYLECSGKMKNFAWLRCQAQ